MARPFEHTLQSLSGAQGRAGRWFVVAGVSILGLWAWSAASLPLSSTLSSVDGRIVARTRQTDVVSLTTEPIVSIDVGLGDRVNAGDPLLRFDSSALELELESLEQSLETLTARSRGIRNELALARQHHEARLNVLDNELAAARTRHGSSEAKFEYSTAAQAIYTEMRSDKLIDKLKYQEAVANARIDRSELDLRRIEIETLEAKKRATVLEWNATSARYRHEEAALLGSIAETRPILSKLRQEIGDQAIVALDDGVVEDMVPLGIGQTIPLNERLLTIRSGRNHYFEAFFPASTAAGRIVVDSPARISFDALPWTEYGTLPATVVRVGNEEVDGRIRVYLAPDESAKLMLELRHGLKGVAIVENDEATVLQRLFRLIR